MTWRNLRPAAAALLLVAVVAGGRWLYHRPPYGPEALGVESSLTYVTPAEAAAALGHGVPEPVMRKGDSVVLGRISWRTPPEPLGNGHFLIFLIDKRTTTKVDFYGGTSPRGTAAIGTGSASADNEIAERYPWLRGARDPDGGSRLSVGDGAATPLTFAAFVPARPAIANLMLAIAYRGPDQQLYWAHRLQG
ncbi:hypothetical protein AB0F81_26100 [Actinoplanes sp. NPDC024001]|uniref:hypothetical protein n=1 Tax=Actinoplanes sp. NPDC024001 TaxID=3154598 RepID=UPI0033F856AD